MALKLRAAALATAALALLPALAHAGPLGAASDYNLFVFSDVNLSSDTEGRVAVGGNAIFSNYTIGLLSPNANVNSLLVAGNLSYTGGSIHNGNALIVGDATFTGGTTITHGSLTVGGNFSSGDASKPVGGVFTADLTPAIPVYWNPITTLPAAPTSPIDFAAEKSALTQKSIDLAALPANGTTSLSFGTLTLTGSDPSLNVFTLDGSSLGPAHTLIFDVPDASTLLINIDDATVTFDNMGVFLNGSPQSKILYNFHQATSLTIVGVDPSGSILAPNAHIQFTSGVNNGQIIANSISGGGQINLQLFNGDLPEDPGGSVPEPASLTLLALGTLALLNRKHR